MTDRFSRKELYPPINPWNQFELEVGNGHVLYVEQVGNPKGEPVVILHGGPGGGCTASMRRFFDPSYWNIILFDQRGAGRSKPFASLEHNTTWDLVADIEKIREHLSIENWVVFGGSWGSTLSLSYAVTHPDRVNALILRGIFLLRDKEIEWFYQDGASLMAPDLWEKYIAPIPQDEQHDFLDAFYRRLTSDDSKIRKTAAQAWAQWEGNNVSMAGETARPQEFDNHKFNEAFARIECHYFVNKGFFESDGWLLAQIDKIRSIPGIIVQGRYDLVTPMASAWDLHRAWPEAELRIISDAGHASSEPGIIDALVRAGDRYMRTKSFKRNTQ